MWFSKDKGQTREKQDLLWDKLSVITISVTKLEHEIENVKQGIKVLRGFVNRKFQMEDPEPEKEEEVIDTVPFSDGFDEIRKISKEAK